ncbi:hypothetical protein [Jatrophihabitans sp.]|uniref:hypothetical protein n=1 Tax=Jatrophihabitans sp. TaxID=1932789 RepID=UPI0030C7439C|nr:hypothetical protein [Jatrophihabitans sp.]
MTRPTDAEVYARHPDLQMADAVTKLRDEQQAAHAAKVAAETPRTIPAGQESMSIEDALSAHFAAQNGA